MRIAYHFPSKHTIYAQRTIYNGFKHAFADLGHDFHTFSADDNLPSFLEQTAPHVFITASHFYYQQQLDLSLLKQYRDRQGLVVFVKIDFWKSPMSKFRINEAHSLCEDRKTVDKIKEGLLGDVFFHVVEQDDERMDGFEKGTGLPFHTIPLAADKTVLHQVYDKRFEADISYIGTNLPEKRAFFRQRVFPLRKKYTLALYGQDWTRWERFTGWLQRAGQFFNVPLLRSLQKPKLGLEDEAKIYSSSLISINVHEQYQRDFGGDCNERTFKIPLCEGFEITDKVGCISRYFEEDKEIIIARDERDWFDKIDYFIRYPEKRYPIIAAGKNRVLAEHTYHNRAEQILKLYEHMMMGRRAGTNPLTRG
jgi:hypothetical protein